jgi:hypothetical protein
MFAVLCVYTGGGNQWRSPRWCFSPSRPSPPKWPTGGGRGNDQEEIWYCASGVFSFRHSGTELISGT